MCGKPDVVGMAAQIVVRHAHMLVHFGYEGIQLVLRNLGRAQRGAETEFGRLEVGPQTPDKPGLAQGVHAIKRFLLRDAETLRNDGVRPGLQRKIRLDDVQNALVHRVESHFRHSASFALRGWYVHRGSSPM